MIRNVFPNAMLVFNVGESREPEPGVWLTNSFNDRGKVNLELGVGDGAGGGGYGN